MQQIYVQIHSMNSFEKMNTMNTQQIYVQIHSMNSFERMHT